MDKIDKKRVLIELEKLKCENMYNQYAYVALEEAVRVVEKIEPEE